MSDQNGLRQTPFSDAFATPDIGGTGLNGTGGGLDDVAGPNGISNSPFKDAVPAPGMGATSDGLGGPYRETIDIAGGSPKGTQLPHDIDLKHPNSTLDKR
jgi:hypothetical protein